MTSDQHENGQTSFIERRLCTLPIFSAMSSAGLGELLKFCALRAYAVGQILFQSGDSPGALYIVLDGQIEWTAGTSTGGQEFMGFIDPVEILVLESVFSRKPYAVAARAQTDARVLVIPLNVLQARLRADPGFANALLVELAERTQSLVEENAALAVALDRFVHSER